MEKVQNETTFATWKFCYGKLKDNMLQGTLQAVGEERERGSGGGEREGGPGELVQGIHVATC